MIPCKLLIDARYRTIEKGLSSYVYKNEFAKVCIASPKGSQKSRVFEKLKFPSICCGLKANLKIEMKRQAKHKAKKKFIYSNAKTTLRNYFQSNAIPIIIVELSKPIYLSETDKNVKF